MIIIAICTEGESSEPNYLGAYRKTIFGTTPNLKARFEINPNPLSGNQGHSEAIFKKAEVELQKAKNDKENLLSITSEEDRIEKWLIVDYDRMEKHGVKETEFRRLAEENGYNIIINRPNFEFFVLCHFIPVEEAKEIKNEEIKIQINEEIKKYNKSHGYSTNNNQALKLPLYSKKRYVSKDLFDKLMAENIKLLKMIEKKGFTYGDKNHYSEMYKLFNRINNLESE